MEELALVPFILTVVWISLSGVLMPGPVTAVTVAGGSEDPHAGAWVAAGHAVIEVPVIALIFFGVRALFKIPAVQVGIGLIGGLVLFWMGLSMLRDFDKVDVMKDGVPYSRSPFLAGILLSIGNPYFLVWWATAGALLVDKSLYFGLAGFAVLVVAHWSCDYVWLHFLSFLSHQGRKFFGRKLQQGVFLLCGHILIFFTGYFGSRALLTLAEMI
ncbi:MAG: LysE family transporter [bacterium]